MSLFALTPAPRQEDRPTPRATASDVPSTVTVAAGRRNRDREPDETGPASAQGKGDVEGAFCPHRVQWPSG